MTTVQIDDQIRLANETEQAALDQRLATSKLVDQIDAENKAIKLAARAKLKALGLTDDEIAALVG